MIEGSIIERCSGRVYHGYVEEKGCGWFRFWLRGRYGIIYWECDLGYWELVMNN